MEIQDQPYLPPRSMSAAAEWEVSSTEVELPRTSVVFMILMQIVTLGLYDLYWFLRRRRALNQLWPEQGVDGRLAAYGVLHVGNLVAALVVGLGALGEPSSGWVTLLQLAAGIANLALCFRVKDILEATYHDSFSGVGTFIFRNLYLQYKMNRIEPKSADGSLLGIHRIERPAA